MAFAGRDLLQANVHTFIFIYEEARAEQCNAGKCMVNLNGECVC